MQYSHQNQEIAQMQAAQDMDAFPYQPCECARSNNSYIADFMPASGLKIIHGMFTSMKLLTMLKSPTHRAQL